jgi:hypothetical protein
MSKAKVRPEHSLRYALISPGVIRWHDGREQCLDTPDGWKEYKRRVALMLERQEGKCGLCGKRLYLVDATFDHSRRRGMHASRRDDRVSNGVAAHWLCNVEKG